MGSNPGFKLFIIDTLLNMEMPAPVVVHYDPGWPSRPEPCDGSSPVYRPVSYEEYLAGSPPPLSLEEQAARLKAHKDAQKKKRAEARELEGQPLYQHHTGMGTYPQACLANMAQRVSKRSGRNPQKDQSGCGQGS